MLQECLRSKVLLEHIRVFLYKGSTEYLKASNGGNEQYLELVKAYCGTQQIAKLRKLLHFTFKKHEKYNLNDKRLKMLANMIQERAMELIQILEAEKN